MSQTKQLQSLQTVIFGSINSGSSGKNRPRFLDNGTLAFSVPINSGEKDKATGKHEFTQWVQVYVSSKHKNAQFIAENACDKKMFLRFEGFIKASAYIDKEGKPQANLTLNCFDIKILKDGSDNSEDTSFDPAEFSDTEGVDFTPPQI